MLSPEERLALMVPDEPATVSPDDMIPVAVVLPDEQRQPTPLISAPEQQMREQSGEHLPTPLNSTPRSSKDQTNHLSRTSEAAARSKWRSPKMWSVFDPFRSRRALLPDPPRSLSIANVAAGTSSDDGRSRRRASSDSNLLGPALGGGATSAAAKGSPSTEPQMTDSHAAEPGLPPRLFPAASVDPDVPRSPNGLERVEMEAVTAAALSRLEHLSQVHLDADTIRHSRAANDANDVPKRDRATLALAAELRPETDEEAEAKEGEEGEDIFPTEQLTLGQYDIVAKGQLREAWSVADSRRHSRCSLGVSWRTSIESSSCREEGSPGSSEQLMPNQLRGASRSNLQPLVERTRRRQESTGLSDDIIMEGWLLKEAGSYGKGQHSVSALLKAAIPRRRYVVLFETRICYFAELEVKMPTEGDPGVILNEFNTVVDFRISCLPPPSGLKWRKMSAGDAKLIDGEEMDLPELANMLRRKVSADGEGVPSMKVGGIELTKSEWRAFGVKNLSFESFVRHEDGACFQPEALHGQIEIGDVLTEVDKEPVAGESVVWNEKIKHVVRLIRMKGVIPLREGVDVRPCRSLINRINRDASSFEVDLSKAVVSDMVKHAKARYTFICQNLVEAAEWQRAIRRQVPITSNSAEASDAHGDHKWRSEAF